MVASLDIFDIERACPFALGNGHHLICCNEYECGIGIDEFLDALGTGYAVHFDVLAGTPLRRAYLPMSLLCSFTSAICLSLYATAWGRWMSWAARGQV